MKEKVIGDICGEIDRYGRVRELIIRSQDGFHSKVSKNENWGFLLKFIGCRVEAMGSYYFLPNRERVMSISQVQVLSQPTVKASGAL